MHELTESVNTRYVGDDTEIAENAISRSGAQKQQDRNLLDGVLR